MRDAELVILDEPTAALDAKSEAEVFARFKSLAADKTAVLISHRFSTVKMADRILVLKNGTIAEQGPHYQLVNSGVVTIFVRAALEGIGCAENGVKGRYDRHAQLA